MKTLTFRPAIENDVIALYSALKSMVNEQKIEERFTLTQGKLSDTLFSTDNAIVDSFCAFDKEKIAGFVLFSDTNRNFDLFEGPGLYVHDIFVYPEFRRQGVGRELMKKVIDLAKEKNCCRIDWVQFKNNSSGDQFFKSIQGTKSVDYIDYKRISL